MPTKRSRRSETPAAGTPPQLLVKETFPPEPRQERSRKSREALLRAALVAFEKDGYEATTIAEITRRAKVAVGGFYLHFRSKRQLLLVLMDRLVQELAAVGPAHGTVPDPAGARALVATVVREALRVDRKYVGIFRAWREAVLGDRELAALQRDIDEWSMHRLVEMLSLVSMAPDARPGFDVPQLARILHALFWRLAEQRAGGEEEVIAATTFLIVHALFRDGA